MKLGSNTVLITGGASGIGLAMAEKFLAAGSQVLVCGRREDRLRQLKERLPEIHTRTCDVGSEAQRRDLFEWATRQFPTLNVLVNNAGIQRKVDFKPQAARLESWSETSQEIAINLEAPIHLSQLFSTHLSRQKLPAIINITSGLSFSPLANVPIYCATKAALHSFTLSLRHQLKTSGIQVIEIAPPAVDTDLGGVGLHTFGVNLTQFTDAVMERLARGELEIAYGNAEIASHASRTELDEIFTRMNPT